MSKRFQPLLAFLILALAMLACSFPMAGAGSPASTPDAVATIVASTLQAQNPGSSGNELLPHTLYFLASDSGGLTQVFRLEKDGRTKRQVTSEPAGVGNYGVSPLDGSVAFVVTNQLVLVNADGTGRRVLVDGGPVDPNNAFVKGISNPVFSPDGQTLAYGHLGLNFYSLATGNSTRVLENQVQDLGNGVVIPSELYSPEKYSPNGSRLLITLGYYEGASSAIYDPASKGLVRLQGGEGALICCDLTQWSADGSSFYSANPAMGMFNSGLWKVDAATGTVTTLFSSSLDSSEFKYAGNPYLAPDGQLYYFFANSTQEYNQHVPLQLVRSAPDGVTGRTVLRQQTFEMMNEALWSPDARFVIVANTPDQDTYQGGVPTIVYVDGRPDVQLADFAQQMEWGP